MPELYYNFNDRLRFLPDVTLYACS